MSIWEKYPPEARDEYIKFLQIYGALTKLFKQKHVNNIPHLDSKFQETIFAKIFHAENVDIGNTPHDILSIIDNDRIGIGLKTWMNTAPSFQKVMQIKKHSATIDFNQSNENLAYYLSTIKNERMIADYKRLGLSYDKNIYHYITRDANRFVIHETHYPLIDINSLNNFNKTDTSFSWSDKHKQYKFTYSDAQIWQYFDPAKKDSMKLHELKIQILDDPFDFLLKAYLHFIDKYNTLQSADTVEVYLPLYSYSSKEVGKKSGLNAWNSSSKSPNSSNPSQRPLNEIYIPIPRIFHKKYPGFFCSDIFKAEKRNEKIRFTLQLPNGKQIPALITQSNSKALQSGSSTEKNPDTGKKYGQEALGQWLLIDVLGLKERQPVTRQWLEMKGTDSVRLWRKKNDYSKIYIDFAPINSFETFIVAENVDTPYLNE